MKSAWVDFKVVKEEVTIEQVLGHYQINWLRKTGSDLRGKCPIHEGAEGERAFHVNVEKNVFRCFSCGAKGNILDLVAAMEQVSIREAALKLQEWFLSDQSRGGERQKAAPTAAKKPKKAEETGEINKPLGFELRVDPAHEYGKSRGVTQETLEHFSAGFCLSKGTFSGRFIVPLHNPAGELVGYIGRSVDGSEPRYLVPKAEKGFRKSHLLFNLHRVQDTEEVVLVEGVFDCMKVHEAGFAAVALLGNSMSQEQEALIHQHFKRVVVMLDGDDAGRAASEDCVDRLVKRVFVRVVSLPKDKQPDELGREELQKLLNAKESGHPGRPGTR